MILLLTPVALSITLHAPQLQAGFFPASNSNCPGQANSPPHLSWSSISPDSRYLALTLYDPDAKDGFWHWVVYDIPVHPHSNSIESGTQTVNDWGV